MELCTVSVYIRGWGSAVLCHTGHWTDTIQPIQIKKLHFFSAARDAFIFRIRLLSFIHHQVVPTTDKDAALIRGGEIEIDVLSNVNISTNSNIADLDLP